MIVFWGKKRKFKKFKVLWYQKKNPFNVMLILLHVFFSHLLFVNFLNLLLTLGANDTPTTNVSLL